MKPSPRMAITLLPGALGFASAALCPVDKGAGSSVWFRPPPIAFGIVWTVLYALLGYSAYLASWSTARLALHALLSLMLAAWMPLHSGSCAGRKREALWLISLSALLCCYVIATDGSLTTMYLLLPLLGWLCFAALISAMDRPGQ